MASYRKYQGHYYYYSHDRHQRTLSEDRTERLSSELGVPSPSITVRMRVCE